MYKKKFISSILFLVTIIFLSFSSKAFAMTPTLSLSPSGDGDSVQLNIAGDPGTSVLFNYIKKGVGLQITSLGNTNSSGTLVTTVSSSQYGIVSDSLVYVSLGGINGTQSSQVSWPAVSSLISSSNMLSLSQTGLVLQIGQSSTITATNMNSSSLYLSSNTNSMIANVNISGSQVTILANSYGTTVATVCLISNSSNCSSVYITVQNSSAQPLTFSQSSVSIYSGQNISIQIYGGSGSYIVLNNASQNGGIIQTSISGSTITLTTASTSGSSSITVCSTNMSSCGIINVTFGSGSSSVISFSQSNPTVIVGQSLNVSVYGPASSLFYVSSNSNPNIVQANLSGNTLTLFGITNGTSNVNVCVSANNCQSLTVTINSNTSNIGGYPILSQDNVSLKVGNTINITVSGGSMPYSIFSNTNNIFQPTLNVNMLSIYGVGIGSGTMNVCSSSGNCATISVAVNNTSSATTLPAGCYSTTGYSQTTGLACSSNIPVATVTIPVGCTSATLFSTTNGQACPNYVYTPTDSTTTTTPASTNVSTPTSTTFKFTTPLKLGSSGTEVTELQKRLKDLGYYKGKIDGGYGATTEKAVKAFQKAHNLSQLGNVGPGTRALLNK